MPRKPPTGIDTHRDQSVRDENGKRTTLTIPVAPITRLAPDPGRGMMPPTGHQDPVYAKFLESRDLDELKFALATSTAPKALAFLGDLIDPTKAATDITTLAKRRAIGLVEMMQIWRSHKLTSAMGVHIDGAPSVAADVVLDALSTIICCTRCDGAGVIRVTRHDVQEWIDCPHCQATGATRKPGDPKARDLVYQTVGFTKASGGVSVNIQHNTSNVESVLDELERATAIPVGSVEIPMDDA